MIERPQHPGGTMNNLDLLLAHFDDQRPALSEGLPYDAAADGPRPVLDEEFLAFRYDPSDPQSLPMQRWGIVAPRGAEGDRLLSLVNPLMMHRQDQQREQAVIYRAPRDMNADASVAWWNEVYSSEDVDLGDRPRYLLLLGDADSISWELQRQIAANLFAGRLTFPNDQGYEAYCAKVIAQEKASPEPGARAAFYTVRDGTAATAVGHRGLVAPALEALRNEMQRGDFKAKEIVELGDDGPWGTSELFAAFADRQPTMMFTMSHGLGAPKNGWRSVEEQRRFQGAMSLGVGGQITQEDVANRPFLPCGVWFYNASFGVGTPRSSAYAAWLAQLAKSDHAGTFQGSLAGVHESLREAGQPPFVAALPQAALANPDGPIAVMGQADLAWAYAPAEMGKRNRLPIHNVFRALAQGSRIGCAFYELQRGLINANTELTALYDREEWARRRGLPPDDENTAPLENMKKATFWMLSHDLGTYVLLGDPAARLNVG
jgi:hypothetical protein